MAKAATEIRHATTDDEGKVTQHTIAEGDDVDKSLFTDEQYQQLVDGGAVAEEEEQEPKKASKAAAAAEEEGGKGK